MRTTLTLFSLLLLPFSATAQIDPGMQAAQQAQQAAQQASQQALQQMQQANEASQQAMQNAQSNTTTPCCVAWTAPPKFSIKPGKYPGPTTVRITDATRGAVIYYSTDGWTPTVSSPRYRGPIQIDSSMTLQAIAIAPYSMRSVVTTGQYTIAGAASSSSMSNPARATVSSKENLIPVPLIFDAEVTSRTAFVGDKVPMELSEELHIGDYIVNKGTPASVTITQVDRSGIGGAPGSISFEAEDLHPAGGPIALLGGATRDGEAKLPNASVLIPMVGPFTALRHGTDAVIAKGTPFTAYIDFGNPPAIAVNKN